MKDTIKQKAAELLHKFNQAVDAASEVSTQIEDKLKTVFNEVKDQVTDILDREEKEMLGVNASLDQKRAYKIFSDLIGLLKIVGVKNFVILVDELEKITLLSKTKEDKYLEKFRQCCEWTFENQLSNGAWDNFSF